VIIYIATRVRKIPGKDARVCAPKEKVSPIGVFAELGPILHGRPLPSTSRKASWVNLTVN
jgi:hypothetical protein